jgi:hypothetical protein
VCIGHLNSERITAFRKLVRRAKPGIETMSVDLGLDSGESLFPKIHRRYLF